MSLPNEVQDTRIADLMAGAQTELQDSAVRDTREPVIHQGFRVDAATIERARREMAGTRDTWRTARAEGYPQKMDDVLRGTMRP